MPLAEWPTGLPSRPLKDGFSSAHHAPLLASEMEDGPDIMRVQSRTLIEEFIYPLYFTHAQYAAFKAFAIEDLDQARDHFTMPVYIEAALSETRRVYLKNARWRPVSPYRLGWIIRPVLCVFPAVGAAAPGPSLDFSDPDNSQYVPLI
jgi:hypothetical protein